jgi:CBS domain-containing protein
MTATASTATSPEGLLGRVAEAMTGEVVVLEADTPVDVALRRLEHTQVSGAPVVDHRRVVGVVTLRDLLVPVLADGPVQTTGPFHRHEHQLTTYRVHELMTAEPVTARADWPLAQAVLAIEQAGINRLPVVDPLAVQGTCLGDGLPAPSSTASSSPHRRARSSSPRARGPVVPSTKKLWNRARTRKPSRRSRFSAAAAAEPGSRGLLMRVSKAATATCEEPFGSVSSHSRRPMPLDTSPSSACWAAD